MRTGNLGLHASAPSNTAFLSNEDGVPTWNGRLAKDTANFLALLAGDVAAVCVSYGLVAAFCFYIGFLDAGEIGRVAWRPVVGIFAVAAACAISYLIIHAHYTKRVSFWAEIRDVGTCSAFAAAASLAVAELVPALNPYAPMAACWLLFPFVALSGRRFVRLGLEQAGTWRVRAVVLGEPALVAAMLPGFAADAKLGLEVAATIHPDWLASRPQGRSWRSLLGQHDSSLLVICLDGIDEHALETALASLRRDRVPFAVARSSGCLPPSAFHHTSVFGSDVTVLTYRNQAAQPSAHLSKIVADLVIASVCLAIMLPLLLIVAVLVKLDGGPLLYGQPRVGLGGRMFACYKFRSMVVDSDAALQRLLSTSPAAREEWEQTRKLRNDPRVTRVGRILRATSLDELPQLFNVLRLEMSLVGPRPIVPAEVPRYGDDINYYYQARPGLTGLWQISGRSNTTYVERVRFDRSYVRTWTFWYDIAILAKTIPAVLRQRGAH